MRELTIGEIIKKRRQELKMSAATLAELIGKDRATLYRYEKNEIIMPLNIVKSIAKALNMPLNELIGNDITVGLGDDNESEAWTPAADGILTEVQDIPQKEAELVNVEQCDIDLSYQRFKALLRERKQHEERLIEINTELLMYQDACHCILMDLKTEGLTDENR